MAMSNEVMLLQVTDVVKLETDLMTGISPSEKVECTNSGVQEKSRKENFTDLSQEVEGKNEVSMESSGREMSSPPDKKLSFQKNPIADEKTSEKSTNTPYARVKTAQRRRQKTFMGKKGTEMVKRLERHECPQCGLVFCGLSRLQKHMTATQHVAPYACVQCNRPFKDQASLDRHHVERHQCPHCSRSFLFSSALNDHIRIHRTEKLYVCEVCGRLEMVHPFFMCCCN